MAYFSLHAYDADVKIPMFRGLNQADINLNPDIRYAAEAVNVETPHGTLQPQAGLSIIPGGEFEGRVETLAVLHRRWYSGPGSNTWYIAACGGKLYQKQKGENTLWDEISLPQSVNAFQSDVWSYVTYEVTTLGVTVDVLLMSNAKDGMILITPPDRPTILQDLAAYTLEELGSYTLQEMVSPRWAIQTVNTQGKKFGVIERFEERIWGSAIPDEPDMLMYSRPYDPTDWTQAGDDEEPEDGAGDILQPSWDGDRFYAERGFGNQFLAFKKNRIWGVLGVSPGEYTFQEYFGEGTEYFNTIAVAPERVYMAGRHGLMVFDGMSTTPYAHDQIEQIWRTVNKNALDQMCAALFQQRYYLAFPTGDSPINNAMLVYNFDEGTILYYKDFYIEAFLSSDEELLATSSTLPGQIVRIEYDSWESGRAYGNPCKWMTPWMDFGYEKIQKGGFDLYFLPEVQDEAVEFTISIETEKKTKTKTYTVLPTDKEHRMKRLHFGGSGRRFRVIIETAAGVTAPWRLLGGLQLVVETDPD